MKSLKNQGFNLDLLF